MSQIYPYQIVHPEIVVRHMGNLALVGTSKKENGNTLVAFQLVFNWEAPLAQYLTPHERFYPNSLLFEIFVGEGLRVLDVVFNRGISGPACENQKTLIFYREVTGDLRDLEKFLHATANKLLRELQQVEDNELSILDSDDEVDWANRHYGEPNVVMPDFTRPRHE